MPFSEPWHGWIAGAAVASVAALSFVPIPGLPREGLGCPTRLLTLGLGPFISANSLVAMAVILLPALRRRAFSRRERDLPTVAVYALTVALSLYQALMLAQYLGQSRSSPVSAPVNVFITAFVCFSLGALLVVAVALAVNRVCGGHGFSLMVLTPVAVHYVNSLTQAGPMIVIQGDTPGVRIGAFLVPLVWLGTFALVCGGLLWERTVALRHVDGAKETVWLPMPVALAGTMPLIFAGALLNTVLALAWVQKTGARQCLAYGAPGYMAIQAALALLFVCVYAVIVLRPRVFRDQLGRHGLALVAEHGGRVQGNASLARLLWPLQLPWLGVLLAYAVGPQLLAWAFGIPMALAYGFQYGATVLAALVAALVTQQTARRRGWQAVFRHHELNDVLVVRALLLERGIVSVIGWQEAYGALLGMFIGPLAVKCLYVPGERSVEAAGIVEEYRLGPLPAATEAAAPPGP